MAKEKLPKKPMTWTIINPEKQAEAMDRYYTGLIEKWLETHDKIELKEDEHDS